MLLKRSIFLTLFILSFAGAHEKGVHEILADSALHSVLRRYGTSLTDGQWCLPLTSVCIKETLVQDETFGSFSALDRTDLDYNRYQKRGKTILDQLSEIDSGRLAEIIQKSRIVQGNSLSNVNDIPSIEIGNANVIVNYLVHHLAALHLAAAAGSSPETGGKLLQAALLYESRAQSYMIDAFSGGHLLIPRNYSLSFLTNFNTKAAHDYYGNIGVYVINSHGDVWQTFDERLFEWYEQNFNHVFAADTSSLNELFLTYYASKDSNAIPDSLKAWGAAQYGGDNLCKMVQGWLTIADGKAYMNDLRLPTLLFLPTPISGTWSLKAGEFHRFHFPQIADSAGVFGFHDPDEEGIDESFIYGNGSFPIWLQPHNWYKEKFQSDFPDGADSGSQRQALASRLVKKEPSVASVRFTQERDFPPAYFGLLFHSSAGINLDHGTGLYAFGVGFSPTFAIDPDIKIIDRFSTDASIIFATEDESRKMLAVTTGISVNFPKLLVFDYARIDLGYVAEVGSGSNSSGVDFSIGLETPPITLPFNYWGIMLRPKYQYLGVENIIRSFALEMVIM
jgi:hypothetical protein